MESFWGKYVRDKSNGSILFGNTACTPSIGATIDNEITRLNEFSIVSVLSFSRSLKLWNNTLHRNRQCGIIPIAHFLVSRVIEGGDSSNLPPYGNLADPFDTGILICLISIHGQLPSIANSTFNNCS